MPAAPLTSSAFISLSTLASRVDMAATSVAVLSATAVAAAPASAAAFLPAMTSAFKSGINAMAVPNSAFKSARHATLSSSLRTAFISASVCSAAVSSALNSSAVLLCSSPAPAVIASVAAAAAAIALVSLGSCIDSAGGSTLGTASKTLSSMWSEGSSPSTSWVRSRKRNTVLSDVPVPSASPAWVSVPKKSPTSSSRLTTWAKAIRP
mmetsp:Transcript_24898/g.49996  ORF Transcript_24898/g.49996 Transcript_24898/m.49996 type:complete len:208 (-) Transcript_24898:175-798(-)